jgi:hypothetical protein
MANESSTASTTTTATPPAPELASTPAVPRAPRDHTVALAALKLFERSIVWLVGQLIKPKARVVVVGILLIVFGAFVIDHSVWTFPMVVIGAIMIIVAWVGTRLEGRFGIEWGDGGAGFEMRARFRPALEMRAKAPHLTVPAPASSTSTDTQPRTTPAPVEDDVIEGEAHTIEIDVEELKALVAAAERANHSTATATTNGTTVSWQEVPLRHDPATDN